MKSIKLNTRNRLRRWFGYRRIPALALALIVTGVLWCMPESSLAGNKPIEIFVSILPQKYFVKRVGGENVDVHVMVGPGRSPATYEPTPKQMVKLAQADIFFRIGSPFEEVWMKRIQASNPQIRIIDARDVVELREMETSTLLGQSTGAASGHDHGLKDPHIWTDPVNVKKFMQEFTAKLVQLYPRYEISFTNHFQQFAEELDELDRKLQALFQSISSKHFLVFHPSWGYFADRYGLVQVPIELEGKTPSAKELASVIDYAKKYKIKHVFVQQQFSRKNAQTVAHAIGGEVVTVDPLAEDYMNNLIKVAQLLAGSMK